MYNVHSFHPWLKGCCHNCGTSHLDSPTKLIDSQSFEHLSYELVDSALIWFMQSDKAINGLIQSVSYLHVPKLVGGLLHVGRNVTLRVADIWLSLDPPVSILDGCVSVLAHLQICRPQMIIVTMTRQLVCCRWGSPDQVLPHHELCEEPGAGLLEPAQRGRPSHRGGA